MSSPPCTKHTYQSRAGAYHETCVFGFPSGSPGTTTGNSSKIHEPVHESHGTTHAGKKMKVSTTNMSLEFRQ
jgi:hypothetical protein